MKKKRGSNEVLCRERQYLFVAMLLTMALSVIVNANISTSLINGIEESDNIPISNEILESTTKPRSFEKEIIGRLSQLENNFFAVNNRVEDQQKEIIFLKSVVVNQQNEKEIKSNEESEVFPDHHKREKRQMLKPLPKCSTKACAFDTSTQVNQNSLSENNAISPIVIKKPTSCEDLKSMGHSVNGFYLIQATTEHDTITVTNKILAVYCDFSLKKLQSTLNVKDKITENIGYVETKSLANGVQFYVQRNFTLPEKEGVNITFQLELLNIGGAMNLTTGVFKAPVPGKYFFSFSAIKGNNLNSGTEVYLYHNNELVGAAYGTVGKKTTLVLQSVLQLELGDEIFLQKGLGDTILFEKVGREKHERTTHFTGWLLEENS